MKYLIVSTYPKTGSMNAGDKLIEVSTRALIEQHDTDAEFVTVFRGDSWESASVHVDWADCIVFACLAIRNDIEKFYPFIRNVINGKKPIAILAAGSEIDPNSTISLSDQVSSETRDLLLDIDARSSLTTTRGRITDQLCQQLKLPNCKYSGDVAFFRKSGSDSVKFSDGVSRIILSDPHYEGRYLRHFERLILGTKQRFPSASLSLVLHGNRSTRVEAIAKSHGIEIHRAYEDPLNIGAIYEQCDLHIGFRVHGHVSALKSGAKSYLLEQDGRGLDYGVSFSPKISVPAWTVPHRSPLVALKTKLLFQKTKSRYVPVGCVDQIFALIDRDLSSGFEAFSLVSDEISRVNSRLRNGVEELVTQLKNPKTTN